MSDVPANQLFDAYFTAAPMRAVFSDRGRLQGMLDFEAALARAEARTGGVLSLIHISEPTRHSLIS
ncbi:hypothetical protein KZ850_21225, partial [Pseudomonas aeruginosa]|nr:hypothetical protein [Pseudomonas aeruginosa]